MEPFLRRERIRFRTLVIGVPLGGIIIAWFAHHPAFRLIVAVVAIALWLAVAYHYDEDAIVHRAWKAHDRASRPRSSS